MRSLLHRTMNFAYIEKGVPRVVSARVMIQFPPDLINRAKHVLSNIAMQRTNLFVIKDEDYEYHNGRLETDHISWKISDRVLTAIPRADRDPNNRSCICCAIADYLDSCMKIWLRSKPEAIDLITLDVVVSDSEDRNFIDANALDFESLFFEASVYVMESGTNSWTSYGLFYTDRRKHDGATIFLYEEDANNVSVSNANAVCLSYSDGDVHGALATLTDRFGVYAGLLTVKD